MLCRRNCWCTVGLVIVSICLATCKGKIPAAEMQPTPIVNLVEGVECTGSETCSENTQCFGLFVDMQDRDLGMPGYGGRITQTYDHKTVRQRVYMFEAESPITVTATLLVFGSGALQFPISDTRLDYQISVTDDGGNEITKTPAARIPGRHPGVTSGPIVTQYSPYMETFAIDEWFDLSAGQSYTLHVSRTVYISNTAVYVEGNPVIFHIYPE